MKAIYKFLPYQKMKWETSLRMDKILGRLEANVEEKEFDAFLMMDASHRKSTKRFQGEISKDGFLIMGFTNGPNEAIPMIHGNFEKTAFGHTIDITIRYGTVVNLLGGIAFGVSLIISLFQIPSLFTSDDPSYLSVLAPIAIYGLALFAFKRQTKTYQQFLMEMFEASEVREY